MGAQVLGQMIPHNTTRVGIGNQGQKLEPVLHTQKGDVCYPELIGCGWQETQVSKGAVTRTLRSRAIAAFGLDQQLVSAKDIQQLVAPQHQLPLCQLVLEFACTQAGQVLA